MPNPTRVAVIGSGVSGLVAAYVLSRTHAVTLYEADVRAGGHSHTHDVTLGSQTLQIDSGFIVHNDRTYPTLLRLFAELDVPTQATDMSMSVWHERDRISYAGGRGASGIFADPRTVTRPAYLRMLRDVRRFHQAARTFLDGDSGANPDTSLRDWLAPQKFSSAFTEWFIQPLVAAVWSCDPEHSLDYPARSLLTFLDHHGMLTVTGSPTWRTVVGGSRVYVDRVLAHIDEVKLSTPVASVRRTASGVEVTARDGHTAEYAAAVVATHPHQALSMLAEPTASEQAVLGAITYSVNQAQLHTDDSVLPRRRGARGSWNYLIPKTPTDGVLVSYDLTRLMRLPSPDGKRVLVTLNGSRRIDPDRVIAEMTYEHPLYTTESVAAQQKLPGLSDDRIAFAGAYHGWGFHEDGALSGLRAAERLGGAW
ncbi:NAD(P)/FAD-dependent oxidoreductase [Demetria terragena]|uniref:NAD(P)/FAD-dependent oxidoreductase n=1 Tax=Demetria terragena TaxID=63959 RepID=UPI000399EEC0|nr:FAD-dependent oxidoreductase [Demetria terragena]